MLKILLLCMTKSTVSLGVENGYFELQCLQDKDRCVHNYKCKSQMYSRLDEKMTNVGPN